MTKRIISMFLCIAIMASLMVFAAVPGFAYEFDGGDGSQNDPYLISTAEQLHAFRDLVNGGKYSICAKLTDNIDLGSVDWTPIGLSSRGYTGTFDGSGYAIRNLFVSQVSSGTSTGGWTVWGTGLFGIVGNGGYVKNLNVDGTFSINEPQSKDIDIGGIAGGNLGTIEECFVTVHFNDLLLIITSPSSNSHTTIGGIAGVNSGTIRNCYVVGNIDVLADTRTISVGGIVGSTNASGTIVENCYAAVEISVITENAKVESGGIFGRLSTGGTFRNIHVNSDLCGNLVGSGKESYLSDCVSYTSAYMKSADFAEEMGSAFAVDSEGVNDGYPVLRALVYDEESDWSDWFEDEAMDEVNQEIFNSLIPPELANKDLTKDITRAEFCAVAVRLYEQMLGKTLDATTLTTPFTDTSSDAVKKAYHLGITNGVSATSFAPHTYISREQMATMLTRVYKALNLPGWTLATDSNYKLDYSDVKPFADDQYISGYAKPSVYFMVKNGVIKGTSETTFSPRNLTPYEEAIGYANASREQALIMAVRMFQKL